MSSSIDYFTCPKCGCESAFGSKIIRLVKSVMDVPTVIGMVNPVNGRF